MIQLAAQLAPVQEIGEMTSCPSLQAAIFIGLA